MDLEDDPNSGQLSIIKIQDQLQKFMKLSQRRKQIEEELRINQEIIVRFLVKVKVDHLHEVCSTHSRG